MLFNSIDFALFLPLIFAVYWGIAQKGLRLQNFLIVMASYFFYGWWDWRFLSLIFFSTTVDYLIGRRLGEESAPAKRKVYLWLSLFINLGFLGFFKYYNFFLDNFVAAFSFFGVSMQASSLEIILPIGISFYTFQTLSYTIDVYKRNLEPTKDFIAFAAFVSFFPQLVAGPIERATKLLPQFYTPRTFDKTLAVDGLRQILWGFFKKIVIADSCAETANLIFNNSGDYSGSTLVLGAILFTFQIYGDFSGYSDIAIGTARLFGFKLMRNFAFPYFSRDIAEFWRRWHISLSTWFRDYLYIPLGGSRGRTVMKVRNTFIIFLVSGFWHGANWTYIIWGLLNALYIMPLLLTNNNRNHIEIVAKGAFLPSMRDTFAMLTTFTLTVFAWIFFRANSVEHAFNYIGGICSSSLFSLPQIRPVTTLIVLVFFLIIEWIGREGNYALETIGLKWNRPSRLFFYYVLALVVLLFSGQRQEFIYFQF